MSSYIITVMVHHPGQILPEIHNIRNVRESAEKLLGGNVHIESKDYPIPGVVKIVGPSGNDGSVMYARDAGNHWETLSIEFQKQVMAWHLNGGQKLKTTFSEKEST